jgi:hypothetical protein
VVTLPGKGVNKWSSPAEKDAAVVAGLKTARAVAGVVFGASAETKVKRY